MYYFNTPMIDTDADAIVVPVNLDGVIKLGTFQHEVMRKLPEGYVKEYIKEVRDGTIRAGEPGIYIPDIGAWAGKVVFNLPALKSDSTVVNIAHVMKGMCRVLEMLKTEPNTVTLAVGHLNPDQMEWSTVEFVLSRFEEDNMLNTNVELWLYPPVEEDDRVARAEEILCVD